MINLINTSVSRRTFLGSSIVALLSLDEIALAQTKEDELWEKARKDAKQQQPALDTTLKSSPDLQKLVSRFYSVEIVDAPQKDKWSLFHNGKLLKLSDSRAEASLRKELQNHALAYCNKKKSLKQLEKIEDAYYTLVGDLMKTLASEDADVWLHPLLWDYKADTAKGEPEIKPVGLVPQKFWDKGYKTHQDRLSRLVDYCGKKAGDMIRDVPYEELFKGTGMNKASKLFLEDEKKNPTVLASWKNRAFMHQAKCILDQKRKVSSEYQELFANEWQSYPDFAYVVKIHQARVDGAINAVDLEARRGLADTMGYMMFFNCLPVDGKIVLYNVDQVKDLKTGK